MSRRLSPWQQEKQRTAKALRELPVCATMGCGRPAIGAMFGSDLCTGCEQRQRNEKIHFVESNEPVGITYCGGNIFTGDVPRSDRVTERWALVTCALCKSQRAQRERT